jgi:hypothetical protein
MTEVWEAAQVRSDSKLKGCAFFQPFKLMHALKLADWGETQRALDYVDSILATLPDETAVRVWVARSWIGGVIYCECTERDASRRFQSCICR